MTLSKNVNNKKCAPKLIFFNEKKLREIQIIFDGLGDFALFGTSPLTQFSKFNNFFWVCWFLGKNLSNFVPPFQNSTTRIAIMQIIITSKKIFMTFLIINFWLKCHYSLAFTTKYLWQLSIFSQSIIFILLLLLST